MASFEDRLGKRASDETRLLHLGRDPEAQHGFVNAPIYRGSTVIFPTVEELRAYDREYTYGRRGTPTVTALTSAITALEGGHKSWVAPSGLAAVTMVLMAFAEAGADILITDSVYQPVRRVAGRFLSKLGVETRYYDPAIGAGISELITERTRLVLAESPGSQTFEMQDLPAIAEACRAKSVWLAFDNTWATPLYFKPLAHGADVTIQAATKYVVGHADAMLGIVTANERAAPLVARAHEDLGLCAGPEDCYLALRGLRSMGVRLARHQAAENDVGTDLAVGAFRLWLVRGPCPAWQCASARLEFAGNSRSVADQDSGIDIYCREHGAQLHTVAHKDRVE
ncbi:MAG: cystathionine beta-lyase [Rhodomicrobium sp.]|nr:cystathionine beta-lyase [Rhodomicrobium sp.]